MWTRDELKMRGKLGFQRNYWSAVAVALVMAVVLGISDLYGTGKVRRFVDGNVLVSEYSMLWVILGAFLAALGIGVVILEIFVGNVLLVGGSRFFVLNQAGTPTAGTLGYGFKCGNYGNIVLIMFLRDLFTGLWTLLLIVPGIIKHYEYLMIPYILGENPGMRREEAFLISKKMMTGQKWEVFMLDLSFIGWIILEFLTAGILGIFYVEPYRRATFAELYNVNREMAFKSGYIR